MATERETAPSDGRIENHTCEVHGRHGAALDDAATAILAVHACVRIGVRPGVGTLARCRPAIRVVFGLRQGHSIAVDQLGPAAWQVLHRWALRHRRRPGRVA